MKLSGDDDNSVVQFECKHCGDTFARCDELLQHYTDEHMPYGTVRLQTLREQIVNSIGELLAQVKAA